MLRRATPERLSTFSDGVFAVLVTVLVLELRPPERASQRKGRRALRRRPSLAAADSRSPVPLQIPLRQT